MHSRTFVIRIFLSPMVSPIERVKGESSEVRFADIPPEQDGDRETKRRSAPHETLIESIHGDSGQGSRERLRERNKESKKRGWRKKSPVPRYEWRRRSSRSGERGSVPWVVTEHEVYAHAHVRA